MNRWQAAGIHFALSILIVGGIGASAFLLWHPYGLYKVAGLDRILMVMLGIDLTAGPLLTLIVYRAGKRSLRFDLTVISLAQAAFLAYGLHTLADGRPVFLVGTPETFTVVFANEVAAEDYAQAARPEWRRPSWTGPVLVGTRMPKDPAQRSRIVEEFMAGGAGIERSPKHYLGFGAVAPDILASTNRRLALEGGAPRMPIVSRRGEGMLLIDPVSAEPIRVIR